jgi:hypothetical protein
MFWYKKNVSILSFHDTIIGGDNEETASALFEATRAQMFLASTYRYSADCDENAQIVRIGKTYYKFYFTSVDGYDAYNSVKLVYTPWTAEGWSEGYTVLDDNGLADAAYTILQDKQEEYETMIA